MSNGVLLVSDFGDGVLYIKELGCEKLHPGHWPFCGLVDRLEPSLRAMLPADHDCISADQGPAVCLEIGNRGGDVRPLRVVGVAEVISLTAAIRVKFANHIRELSERITKLELTPRGT